MGQFFKIANKGKKHTQEQINSVAAAHHKASAAINSVKSTKEKRKSHAGKGALVGGAAFGAREAWHIKQVNKPGSKARKKFKEYVKMDAKRKAPIIDPKHAKNIKNPGWKIKDVLRVSNKKSVALIGGVGALLGAIVGEAFKKPLEKKANSYSFKKQARLGVAGALLGQSSGGGGSLFGWPDAKFKRKANSLDYDRRELARTGKKAIRKRLGGIKNIGENMGRLLGIKNIGEDVEKKASPYQQDKHLENYNKQLRHRAPVSNRTKNIHKASKFLRSVKDRNITINTGAKKRGRLTVGHVPAQAQRHMFFDNEYDPKAVGAHFSAPIPSFKKKASEKYKSNPALEKAITSRIALEGSQDPKTMRNLSIYNKLKNNYFTPQFAIDKATDALISKNKQKHGKFIYNTFGNVPDKKYKELTLRSMKKMELPNIRDVHTADSLDLVRSGQKYPTSVDDYFTGLKKKRDELASN